LVGSVVLLWPPPGDGCVAGHVKHVERRVVLDVGVTVGRGALDVLEECVVLEDVTRNLRGASCDHSLVGDVVDPPEGPTTQGKGRKAAVGVVNDEGEAVGHQKFVRGEVGVVGGAEGCSGTCVLTGQQPSRGCHRTTTQLSSSGGRSRHVGGFCG
jgi:hypothetical protein